MTTTPLPLVIDKSSRVTIGLLLAAIAMFAPMFLYLRDIEKGVDKVEFGLGTANDTLQGLKVQFAKQDGRSDKHNALLIRYGDRLDRVEKHCTEVDKKVRDLERRK